MKALLQLGLALVLLLGASQPLRADQQETWQPALAAALALLEQRDFERLGQGVDAIAASGAPHSETLLTALLEGELYHRKQDGRVVFGQGKQGSELRVADALAPEQSQVLGKRELKKIGINNSLRSRIRAQRAALNLHHPAAEVREQAVLRLMDSLDADTRTLLSERYASESSRRVQQAMQMVLALAQLEEGDDFARLQAIGLLREHYYPQVRAALAKQAANPQASAQVQQAAASALTAIEHKAELYAMGETLFFGLSLGSVLVLAAIGLAVTFGVMGVINMAHGELMMLGAYTTYVIQQLLPQALEYSLLLAVPAAFVVAALVGVAIERGVIRFLYGRPLETLLATFGISLVLQQLVRSIFSPLNRSVESPSWMSGTWELNPLFALTLNRLYILAFCLLVFALLFWVLRYTRLGLQVRAVSQNRQMARAMGIRSARVDMLTFALGSGIAGVAGVALSQLTNVGPNLGQAYIVDSFMVVVFGGVGNLWGTLVAGLSLGVANKVMEPYAGAVLAKILVLVFIILFIQKRPRGLFPQKGRAAEA
ncbi:urea ABC transporter permease subunit UrtB [Balneatrix alpica]|uniref:Urea ABC transporter permease subunit UrtB n=1 Tax=Balneatrix alpica TaxID=75684 RepID=A0ABV5ZBS1_9GAMM|nr:urea ABC transporter permease subunit UrtB [Balneatrix alpica]